jgi:hypothetical protein
MCIHANFPLFTDDDLKQKCKDLKQKILKVEDFNKLATLNINRTKTSINRLRLEYSILLERLETRAAIPEVSDVSDFSVSNISISISLPPIVFEF